MWVSVLIGQAAASGCEPGAAVAGDVVFEAAAAVLRHDDASARELVDRAVGVLACERASPDVLGRLWIVDAIVHLRGGDAQAAGDSFAAAARVAPGLWLPGLDPDLRAAYDAAASPGGTGTVTFEPPAHGRPVWIDGTLVDEATVPAGLHLVQVGDARALQPSFAAMIWVGPGLSRVVDTGLPALAPAPDPASPGPPQSRSARLRPTAHALIGAGAALGTPLTNPEEGRDEPGAKLVVPLQLGGGLADGLWWARAEVGLGGLVGGRYLAAGAGGDVIAMPVRLEGALAAGGTVGAADLGGGAGVQWPGRLAFRAIGSWGVGGPWRVEGRVGANVVTERPLEPAAELLFGVRLD